MVVALRNRVFRRLAALYTLNTLLEWVASVALTVFVYDATQSALVTAGMLICKQVIPGLLLSSSSARLGKFGLRTSLLVAWLVGGASLTLVGVLGYGFWVFPLAAAAGFTAASVRAVLRAAVARGVAAEELRGANAALNLVIGLAVPTAPTIAALLIHQQGASAALLGAGACVALLAPLSAILPRLDAGSVEAVDQVDGSTVDQRSSPISLPWLMGLGAVAVCASAMTEPALLPYSIHSLGAGVAGYGAICFAWALGVTVGSLLFTRLLGVSMLRVYVLATLLSGGAYLALGIAPTIEFACAVALVGGVGTGMDWVAIVTAVQESTKRGSEVQVAARLESFATVAPALGIVVGGLLADVFGPRIAVAAPGVLSLCVLAVLAVALTARAPRPSRTAAPVLRSPSFPGGSA